MNLSQMDIQLLAVATFMACLVVIVILCMIELGRIKKK